MDEDVNIPDQSIAEQPKIDRIGFDNFLDDLFGMNIKGLKTIWVLFVSPAKYFKAAKTPAWMDLYTPSFRVWFGLTALSAAMKFLWTAEDAPMRELYADQMQMIFNSIEEKAVETGRSFDAASFDAGASADYLLKLMFLITPFATIILMGLLALVYRAWGEKLSYIVRLRNCFAIIITGSAFGFLTAFLTLVVPEDIFMNFTWFMLLGMFGLYFLTAYRGAYRHLERDQRIGYSIVITFLMGVIVMASSLIALFAAMVPTIINTFPKMGPPI